ncbi:MAG TPA: ABC transporter permease [Vicinamibacterales bacterium]|nr:ABC transporter permease [Vicinamibacterales bacterium]
MNDPHEEFDQELQFHIDQRTRDYLAKGMSPETARAAATQRLGDLARVRRTCAAVLAAGRAAERRRTMLTVSWLDVKLGLRMFARHPGLSLVSVAGLAVAIAISAGYYLLVASMLDSRLPFDEDGRMVVVRVNVVSAPGAGGTALPSSADFERWRRELTSIADLGAFRDDARNLIVDNGPSTSRVDVVRVAAITASGLGLTGVAPALGRSLSEEDERPSSPPVVVIAHEEWQRRLDGDPAVLGRVVRLDGVPHTVVGVLPEGFGFPVNHRAWVPLRADDDGDSASGSGTVHVFGRLADGLSMEEARAELSIVGGRMAAALPATHAHVRPQVQRYTAAVVGVDDPGAQVGLRVLQFGLSLLLVLVAVNVSILVYARTATRIGEIAVRTALGASRARIVAQMFLEALVPAIVAAAAGLGLLSVALRPFRAYLRDSPTDVVPYWFADAPLAVSPGVMLYAVVLATIGAVITGVIPALKATGRRVQCALPQFSTRGAGIRLGGTWTALIVAQVALAVAVLPAALHKAAQAYRAGVLEPPAVVAPLVRGTLEVSPGAAAPDDGPRLEDVSLRTARLAVFFQTLESEPAVSAVTFASHFPGEEPAGLVEIEGEAAQPVVLRVQPNRVATGFFDLFGVRVLAGRSFSAADSTPHASAIIVDQALAERLGAGSVLGRRIRFVNRSRDGVPRENPWLEIVGVVPAFTAAIVPPVGYRDPLPRVYVAGRAGDLDPLTAVVRVTSGTPAQFSHRMREIAAAVHPSLKLHRLSTVVAEIDRERKVLRGIAFGVISVTASVLLLSAAGIYAMMSFTVARRRREIGIRTALGADARRVLLGVFGRAGAQIGGGILLGLSMAAAVEWGAGADGLGGDGHLVLPAVAALMFAVGILAAAGPARRGLAVQPVEALREE